MGARWILAVLILGMLSAPARAQTPTGQRTQINLPKPGTMLGIDQMEGDMVYALTKNGLVLSFKSEPRITEVDPDGPATGILQRGDIIVAIGGRLITTRQAGIDFTNLVAGEPVELVIRRRRRVHTVTIVPTTVAADDSIQVHLPFVLENRIPGDLIDSIMAHVQGESTGGVFDLPVGLEGFGPEPGRTLLGMVLRLRGASFRDKDGTRNWDFDRPPLVVSIQKGGPADVGGLLPGDLLTHIDGVRLDRAAGGKMFSAVRPGQKVVWTVDRSGERLKIETTAAPPPD